MGVCRDVITQEWEHVPIGHYLDITVDKQGVQTVYVTRRQTELSKVPTHLHMPKIKYSTERDTVTR